jgi:arginase family enzyme
VIGGRRHVAELGLAIRAQASGHDRSGPVEQRDVLGSVHGDLRELCARLPHAVAGLEEVAVFGVQFSHGTFMRALVDDGQVDAPRYAQIGLRGYWPGDREFAWQAERGITSLFMHDVRDHGIREVVARALAVVGDGPAYLTVDIDVLDPAFVPGTGTPEPGGLTSAELLWAVRELARDLELVGADLVEVIPTQVGTADASSLVADRIVREILTGIALRRLAATDADAGQLDGHATST